VSPWKAVYGKVRVVVAISLKLSAVRLKRRASGTLEVDLGEGEEVEILEGDRMPPQTPRIEEVDDEGRYADADTPRTGAGTGSST